MASASKGGQPERDREGEWPAHVFAPVAVPDDALPALERHLRQATEKVPTLQPRGKGQDRPFLFHAREEYHISLSHPFAIRYDQRFPLVHALRRRLAKLSLPSGRISTPTVYENSRRTACFLSLDFYPDDESGFKRVVEAVNECLGSIGVGAFFENPLPHISLMAAPHEELERCRHVWTGDRAYHELAWKVQLGSVKLKLGDSYYNVLTPKR